MVGRFLRVVGRAIAVYFSDVLLWLSVAGVLEVAVVLGMAALCIVTAGYFFEGMKKNPIVLALGGVVALTGTFLMFREVRGLIWPPPPVVVAAPGPTSPSRPAPTVTPPKVVPPKSSQQGPITSCSGLTQLSCVANPSCTWLSFISVCINGSSTAPPAPSPAPTWKIPPSYEISACTLQPSTSCNATIGCYWSTLFNRCERLRFGTGLTPAAGPGCYGLNELQCKIRTGCRWLLGGCMAGFLNNDRPK